MMIRPIRILNDRAVTATATDLAFDAEDADGRVRIWVSVVTWERLQGEAPPISDADDRRDFALGAIEVAAARIPPSSSSDGQRVLMIG